MVKKALLLVAAAIILALTINGALAYTIDGDSVYIDDANVRINVTPHTISSPQWVTFEITSKQASIDANVLFRFTQDDAPPTAAEYYNPNSQAVQYNRTCDTSNGTYFYNFTLTPKVAYCYLAVNGTLEWNQSFDSADLESDTIFWSVNETIGWVDATGAFGTATDVFGSDKIYYKEGLSLTPNNTRTMRIYLEPTPGTNGKYDFGIYPSSYGLTKAGIQQADNENKLYLIDPWWTTVSSGATQPYRINITINSSEIDAALAAFPVYVNLSELGANLSLSTDASCGDFRAYNASGTELPREVVWCNKTTNAGELYFKADSISNTADTTFYLEFGGAGVSDYAIDATYGAENVWTTYQAVWHFQDCGTGSYLDSTANDNDGVDGWDALTCNDTPTGKGNYFDGDSDIINVTDSASVSIAGPVQMIVLFNTPIVGSNGTRTIMDKNNEYSSFIIDGGMRVASYGGNSGTLESGYNDSNYHLFMGKYTSGAGADDYELFIDGAEIAGSPVATGDTSADQATTLTIGGQPQFVTYTFIGVLDEVRLKNGADFSNDDAWHKAEYSNLLTNDVFATYSIVINNTDTFRYAINVTVNSSEVDADLTDFPVYVNMSAVGFTFSNFNESDCGDLRVTNITGGELAREVVWCNTTAGTGELYFKADSVSNSTDTVFTIYYGSPTATDYAATDTYGSQNVWSGYKGVYHMQSDLSNSVGGAAGTNNGATLVSCSLGNCYDFESTESDYGDLTNIADTWISSSFAMQAWFKLEDYATQRMVVVAGDKTTGNGEEIFRFGTYNNATLQGVAYRRADVVKERSQVLTDINMTTDTNWHFATLNFNDNGQITSFIVDGTDYGSDTVLTTDIGINEYILLGGYWWNGAASGGAWDGLMDGVVLDDDPIPVSVSKATYKNQKSGSTFLSFGTEVDLNGTPNTAPILTVPVNTTAIYTNTIANFTSTYTDADADAGNVTFYFRVNGSLVSTQTYTNQANGTTIASQLQPANFSKGDTINVTVEAYDGTEYGTNQSVEVTVSNTAPVTTTPVNVSVLYDNATANITVTLTDLDSDVMNLTLFYYVAGSNVFNDSFTNQANGTVIYSSLTSGNFTHGQELNITAQVYDGTNYGTNQTGSYTITNTAPSVNITNPAGGSSITGSQTINWTITDASSDNTLTNVTFNGSVVLSNANNSVLSYVLDSTAYDNGIYNLSVKSCENATSELYCSNQTINLTVFNAETPSISGVNIAPDPSIRLEDITLTATCTPYSDDFGSATVSTFEVVITAPDGDTGTLDISSGTATYVSTSVSGVHTAVFTCTDNYGKIGTSTTTFTSATTIDTSAGGGGGSGIGSFSVTTTVRNATFDATIDDEVIVPQGETKEEFLTVTNLMTKTLEFQVVINSEFTSPELIDHIVITEENSKFSITPTAFGDSSRQVNYYIKDTAEIPEGEYTVAFTILSDGVAKVVSQKVWIGEPGFLQNNAIIIVGAVALLLASGAFLVMGART